MFFKQQVSYTFSHQTRNNTTFISSCINNIPIKNVYGYPCYLYENYNVYYLVDHIIPFPSSEDIFLAYYSKHPQLYVKTDSPESGKASGTNYYQSGYMV